MRTLDLPYNISDDEDDDEGRLKSNPKPPNSDPKSNKNNP